MKYYKLFCVIMSLCTVMSTVGCVDTSTKEDVGHECAFQTTWAYDYDGHYKKCTDENCTDVIDYNEHYLNDEELDEKGYIYNSCIICGYHLYKKPIEGEFKLLPVEEVVYPYVDFVKTYLTLPDAYVSDYCNNVSAAEAPVIIQWTSDADVDYFKVTYSENADYSDGFSNIIDKNERTFEIYNLYSDQTCYVKVEEYLLDGSVKMQSLSFKIADIATRVLHIENLINTRDLGGYASSLGGKIKQGNIYRGSSFEDIAYDLSLNEQGKKVLSEQLKIKSEIELRYQYEINSQSGSSVERVESMIDGCNYYYLPIDYYDDVYKQVNQSGRVNYKQIFTLLADEENYPVYIHCQNGADKTGTLAFFINALLGASYEDLRIDYEMTSFTSVGLRGADRGQNYSIHFQAIYNGLLTYGKEGDSLATCAENFLLDLGVTSEQIASIRRINLAV